MGLTSGTFLFFLLLVFSIYFLINKKYQWIVLLISSYFFYLFSGLGVVVFLLLATIISFTAGIAIGDNQTNLKLIIDINNLTLSNDQKKQYRLNQKRKNRLILTLSLLLIFGALGFLKYYNFIAVNANSLLGIFSENIYFPTMNILLPLGISFYTFQSVGYIIDVNREKIEPDRNFAKFALFLSFFPQLIQGPISRYDQLANQLFTEHQFDFLRFKFGVQLMLWGFFKKLVIADRLGIAVDSIFSNYLEFEGVSIFIGAIFFSIQVYCDFSGGIDIVRGIAEVLGINLVENFRRPFFATSIEDYWRRWHITLGGWMREYVFYPLSLSKTFAKFGRTSRKVLGNHLGKKFPTLVAMLVTFLAVGIWHGPQWKYVAFGLYYGTLISLAIILEPFTSKLIKNFHINTNSLGWRLTNIVFVFNLTTIGRYFARGDGFRHALRLLQRTFSSFNPKVLVDGTLLNLGLDEKEIYLLVFSIVFLFFIEILQEKGIHLRTKLAEQNLVFRWSVYLLGIFSILIFGMYGAEYNAAEFIYRGF